MSEVGEASAPTPAVPTGKAPRRDVGRLVRRVIGELLITAAVLILLFQGWKIWYNDIVFGASQTDAAVELSEQWANDIDIEAPAPEPEPTETEEPTSTAEPVVAETPADAEAFATIMIPGLGKDYRKIVAEGVGHNVLNTPRLGIGHYPSTQLPGQPGNIVLASHRTAYGGAFHNIHEIKVGESVYLETKDGWYKYVYRNTEYVLATQVEILEPVPQEPGVEATDSLLTLTTCNPFLSTAERIIVYNVFDSFYPRADGPPEEIAKLVKKNS